MLFVLLSPHPLSTCTYCSGDRAGDTPPVAALDPPAASRRDSKASSRVCPCTASPKPSEVTKWHPPASQEGLETPHCPAPYPGARTQAGSAGSGAESPEGLNSAPLQETGADQGSVLLLVAVGPAEGKSAELLGLELD